MKEYLSCQLSLCFSSLSERGNLLGSIRAAREHQPPTTKQWTAPEKQIINLSDVNLMQYSLSLFVGLGMTFIHFHFLLVSGSLVLPNKQDECSFHFICLWLFGKSFSLTIIHFHFLLAKQTRCKQFIPIFIFTLYCHLIHFFL